MSDRLELETNSPAETEALGRRLAEFLPRGSLVALRGDLATGKTCLVRGMADHFGAGEAVHSPTFTLVNEYGDDPTLYHIDLYRLTGPAEVAELGYAELFDTDGMCVVEWADRAEPLLPPIRLDAVLMHGGGDRRRIHLENRGLLQEHWDTHLA
jgi:tRNA threonylcarbamoyladenosine biosynthesis protein TsaE